MKRLLTLAAAAIALSSAPLAAQDSAEPQLKLVTPEQVVFSPYWFGQIQAGAGMTVGENDFGKLISPAAAVNVGYRFSPSFGLRIGASGWQAKGSWVNPRYDYKYNYIQGNLDAMLSLTNLFCGFNPTRTLDFYAFLGVGLNNAFNNDEAVDFAAKGYDLEYLWDGHKLGFAGRGGLGVDIRLSNYVAINIEANANGLSDHWNSKYGDNIDWQFNLLAGLTVKFGKNHKVIPAVYEEIIPEPAPAPAPEPEPAPAPAPAPVVKKVEPMTQNIFFLINSARIREEEMAKVNALVEYMKANPETNVTVTGYADKDTGTPSYNMELSQRRADAVKAALLVSGIDSNRILEEAEGDTVQPFTINNENRVVIAIAKE